MSDQLDSAANLGPREVKPFQVFGQDINAALGVDAEHDLRPVVTKVDDATDTPGEIRPRDEDETEGTQEVTHEFSAEPGEPGIPDDCEEPSLSIMDDSPPIDSPDEDDKEMFKGHEAQPDVE